MKISQRINDPAVIDVAYIDKEMKAGKHVIVQFSNKTYTDKHLSILDGLCQKYNEDFGVRFYAHYSTSFDFKTLSRIPNVKSLYVDGLTKADNVMVLTQLNNIQKLSLGVSELTETEILNADGFKHLTELTLGETKTKAFNLQYLKGCKKLKQLIIVSHTKNIEVVGELPDLEYLSLNAVKKVPVAFINKLKNLKTLKFLLGSRENISEIEDNEIENLEIVWVRGFNDLTTISKFRKLKTLLIEDCIKLSKIHFDKALEALNKLRIINCKTLTAVTGFENLPRLNQLVVSRSPMVDFNSIIDQPLASTLKTFVFYTEKKSIDEAIMKKIVAMGYETR